MLKFLSTFKLFSRNIYNLEEVDNLLKETRDILIRRLVKVDEGSPKFDELVQSTKDRDKALEIYKTNVTRELKFFINASLKNYILNDLPAYTKITSLTDTPPSWVREKINLDPDYLENANLVKLDLKSEKFVRELESVCDYIVTMFVSNPFFKLKGHSFEKLVEDEKEHLAKLLRKKAGSLDEGVDYEVILRIGGYSWINLISEKALVKEGNEMGHCVGGYWAQVKNGGTKIYSLHDSKGGPHCTISFETHHNIISQIKGKGNQGTVTKYWGHIKDFLSHLKTTDVLNDQTRYEDLEMNGLYEHDGDIFNVLEGLHIDGSRVPIEEVSEKDSLKLVSKYPVLAVNLDGIPDEAKIEIIKNDPKAGEFFKDLSGRILRTPSISESAISNRKLNEYDLYFRSARRNKYGSITDELVDAMSTRVSSSHFAPNFKDSVIHILMYMAMGAHSGSMSRHFEQIDDYIVGLKDPTIAGASAFLFTNNYFSDNSIFYHLDRCFEYTKTRTEVQERLKNKTPKNDLEAAIISLVYPKFLVNVKDQMLLDVVALNNVVRGNEIPKVNLSLKAKKAVFIRRGFDLFTEEEAGQLETPILFKRLLNKKTQESGVEFSPEMLDLIKNEYPDILDNEDSYLVKMDYFKNPNITNDRSLTGVLVNLDSIKEKIDYFWNPELTGYLNFKSLSTLISRSRDYDLVREIVIDNDLINKKLDFRKDFLDYLNSISHNNPLLDSIIEKYGTKRYIELCEEFLQIRGSNTDPYTVGPNKLFYKYLSVFQEPIDSPTGQLVLNGLSEIPINIPHSVVRYKKWDGTIYTENQMADITSFIEKSVLNNDIVDLPSRSLSFIMPYVKNINSFLDVYGEGLFRYTSSGGDLYGVESKEQVEGYFEWYRKSGRVLTSDMAVSSLFLKIDMPLKELIPALSGVNLTGVMVEAAKSLYENRDSEDLSSIFNDESNIYTTYSINPYLLIPSLNYGQIADIIIRKPWTIYKELKYIKFYHSVVENLDGDKRLELIKRLPDFMRGPFLIELDGVTQQNVKHVPFGQIHLLTPPLRVSWLSSNFTSPHAVYYHLFDKLGDNFERTKQLDTKLSIEHINEGYSNSSPIFNVYRDSYSRDEWVDIVTNMKRGHRDLPTLISLSEMSTADKEYVFKVAREDLGLLSYHNDLIEDNIIPKDFGYGRPKIAVVKGYPDLPNVKTKWLSIPYGDSSIKIRFIPQPFEHENEFYVLVVSVIADGGSHDIEDLAHFMFIYFTRVYKAIPILMHKDYYTKIYKGMKEDIVPANGINLVERVFPIPEEWNIGKDVRAYILR